MGVVYDDLIGQHQPIRADLWWFKQDNQKTQLKTGN